MKENLENEDLENYLKAPPLNEHTAQNLIAAMDTQSHEQENLSLINYRGYMGGQTAAQAAVTMIPAVPQISEKQIQVPTATPIQVPTETNIPQISKESSPPDRQDPGDPAGPAIQVPKPKVFQRFSAVPRNPTETPLANGLIESLTKTIQAAKDERIPETEEQRFQREILETRFRFDPNYKAPPAVLRINGERFGIIEGISLIGGKQKSGKTQLISALAVAYLTGTETCGCQGFPPMDRPELVWIDTEQSVADLHMVLKRCETACNERQTQNLFLYHLRDYRGLELISAVRVLMQQHPRAALFMLDHVGDACPNPNDVGPVKALVYDLHGLAKEFQVHLLLTMHMNKGTRHHGSDANSGAGFEGWLGKEIQKKAETVACVFKEKDSDLRMVECTDARGKEFPSYSFRIGGQDELPTKENTFIPGPKPGHRATLTLQPFQIQLETHRESIEQVFCDGRPLTYSELTTRLKTELTARTGKTCTDALARAYKEHWIQKELILAEGTPNTRSCRYIPADSDWNPKPTTKVPTGKDLDIEAANLFPGNHIPKIENATKRKRKK